MNFFKVRKARGVREGTPSEPKNNPTKIHKKQMIFFFHQIIQNVAAWGDGRPVTPFTAQSLSCLTSAGSREEFHTPLTSEDPIRAPKQPEICLKQQNFSLYALLLNLWLAWWPCNFTHIFIISKGPNYLNFRVSSQFFGFLSSLVESGKHVSHIKQYGIVPLPGNDPMVLDVIYTQPRLLQDSKEHKLLCLWWYIYEWAWWTKQIRDLGRVCQQFGQL